MPYNSVQRETGGPVALARSRLVNRPRGVTHVTPVNSVMFTRQLTESACYLHGRLTGSAVTLPRLLRYVRQIFVEGRVILCSVAIAATKNVITKLTGS